jgi:hypothetical protein
MDSPTVDVSAAVVPCETVSRDTFRRRQPQRVKTGVSPYCSKCGALNDRPGQRYCRQCHNAYARSRRPKHAELSAEARRRANCRAYTKVMIRRGDLVKTPCACGSTDGLQARQRGDYSNPFDVDFVCKACRTGVRHVAAA